MTRLRFLYRAFGMLWLLLGLCVLVVSLGYMFSPRLLGLFFQAQAPGLAALLSPWLQRSVSLQQVAGLAFGLFCVFFGIGLSSLRSWARTIGVAFNILMGACLLALAFQLYSHLSTTGGGSSQDAATLLLLFGGLLGLGLIAVGFQLSFPSAMDAFFGFLPTPPPAQAVKCPTCGGPLDLEKARCQKCDVDDAQAGEAPVRARLIGQGGQEYLVSQRRPTRIGRDTAGFDIQLDDPSVSHEHAVIEYVDGHFYLHRLRDQNGTSVNGVRIQDTEIKNGDQIAFGGARFRFITE